MGALRFRGGSLVVRHGGGSVTTLVLMNSDNLDRRSAGDVAIGAASAATTGSATAGGGAESGSNCGVVTDDGDGGRVYALSDFDGPFYANKTRARLAVLAKRGIAITDEVRISCARIKGPETAAP